LTMHACILHMAWGPCATAATAGADARSKWITQLGLQSASAPAAASIPPLVHIPAPLVSRVLYGGENFATAEADLFAVARDDMPHRC
jgi:hypothetical protein